MNHGKSCRRWDSAISSWETGAGVGAEVGGGSGVGVCVGVAEAVSVDEGVSGTIGAAVVGASCVDAAVGVAIAEAVGRGVEYCLCVEVGFVDCWCPDHADSGGAFVGEVMGYATCWVGESTWGPTGSSAHAVRERAITAKPVQILPRDVRSWRNRIKLIRSESYFGAMGYLVPLVPAVCLRWEGDCLGRLSHGRWLWPFTEGVLVTCR